MSDRGWLWIMRAAGLLTMFYGVVGYVSWRHLAKEGIFHGEDWRVVIAAVLIVGFCLVVASWMRPFSDREHHPPPHPR